MSRPVAVFDLDGTVADARHRLHLVSGEATWEQWAKFFDAAVDDPLIPKGCAAVRSWSHRADIVWLTGRPERVRGITEQWIRNNGLPTGQLVMYPVGDTRPTREVKAEYVRRFAATRSIEIVVDDDPRVIALIREMGLPADLATWVPWANPAEHVSGDDR